MSDYQLKDKGIKGDSETTSAIATISYEIENGLYAGLNNMQINDQIINLKKDNKFPKNLEYIDSFLDKNTSLSGVAFRDVNTNIVTIGFAGTNLDNGKFDSMKDLTADGLIVTNGSHPATIYFASGNAFIKKIQKNYIVGTITGHSKAGRDVVVLGIANNIPNIVTYNPAPIATDLLGLAVGKINRGSLDMMKKRIFDYKGNIINIATNNDFLTSISDAVIATYFGKRFTISNNKGHSMIGFLTDSEQLFITNSIEENTTVNKLIGKQMIDMFMKQKLEEISNLKIKFLKQGGGKLSSSQKIVLDAYEALAITKGLKDTVNSKIDELKKMYKSEIESVNKLWQNTTKSAQIVGVHLSYQECLDSLARGDVSEQIIVKTPTLEYLNEISKATKLGETYEDLITRINGAIEEQKKLDKKLASQIRGM